ncbi:MAG: hypothetical protein HQ567_27775 [Candidatus Nealsonbacteria bacterium]|nr:hypothetical protein [Candidatus Nealsonbacteria bacterium]
MGRAAVLALIALLSALILGPNRPVLADGFLGFKADPYKATTSRAARENAVESIPLDQLDTKAQAKVSSVLSDLSVFRRMPIRVIDCDPELYLFLLRNPDVVVNIWEVLKIGSLKVKQVETGKFALTELAGTQCTVEFLYRSHNVHVAYAEGTYTGPLFARPVKGRCLLVLKTGYVREPDGRYYITTRLDTFLSIQPGGAELLTKTFHPLVGKTADLNFVQSMAFLGSLSRTAEVNSRGVQRLASRLERVQPEARQRLAELAAEIPGKYTAASRRKTVRAPVPQVANRSTGQAKQ